MICSCTLAAGCSSTLIASPTIEKNFPAAEIDKIQIDLHRGNLIIERSLDDQTRLMITGAEQDTPFQLVGRRLLIDLPESKPGTRITISLAGEPDLDIDHYQGLIKINQLGSRLTARSAAGEIELVDFSGPEASLWAGRGNILVTGGSGKLIVIGEHGELLVKSYTGPVSISTIMGSIQYIGSGENSGAVNLEADHGPIRATLPENTNYQIEVVTSSGEAVCAGLGLEQTVNGCRGVTGGGNQRFNIRTVSGRIELRIQSELE